MLARLWLLVAIMSVLPLAAQAADHADAPALGNFLLPGMGGIDVPDNIRASDFLDTYIFQSPSNPRNTVIIGTVNPLAGVISGTTFNASTQYEFRIDNNGDALSDVVYTVQFGFPNAAGFQSVTLSRTGLGVIAKGNVNANIPVRGGGLLRAGVFDDPFFFNFFGFRAQVLQGNPNGFQMFAGQDYFAGFNASAIVFEVPSGSLIRNPNSPDISVYTRSRLNGATVDRNGRPVINTVLIVGAGRKDAFNAGLPENDRRDFGAEVQARLMALGNADPAGTTNVLLPDLLTFNVNNAGGFLNGRRLADDVIDTALAVVTSGALTSDTVPANDKAFLSTFPYLAAPHGASP